MKLIVSPKSREKLEAIKPRKEELKSSTKQTEKQSIFTLIVVHKFTKSVRFKFMQILYSQNTVTNNFV